MRTSATALLALGWLGLGACGSETVVPPMVEDSLPDLSPFITIDLESPPNYASVTYPAHYTAAVLAADNTPANNQITDERASLGRVLFYDTGLSINRTIACASCHVQSLGFTDAAVQSVGFEGGTTTNHSMRLGNVRFFEGPEMFWDRRATDVEDQVLQPIQDPVEMGFDAAAGGLPALITRMEQTAYYPALFEWAFGSEGITDERMSQALAQFVRSMVSTGSRFDTAFETAGGMSLLDPNGGIGPVDLPGFTDEENLGLQLFAGRPPVGLGCQVCHLLPTFALIEDSESIGLDIDETVIFKSPSLKNVAVTGPYMHDGRFSTLTQVMTHYNNGVQDSPSLDDRLREPGGGAPKVLGLSADEIAAVVAFMETLTDNDLLMDERFSNPFVN
ncbi:MAG: cytochrome c peroxidase [Gemmatimonadota bacterium]